MNSWSVTGQRTARVLFSLLVAAVLAFTVFQVLSGQEIVEADPDLSGSSKNVSSDMAIPGSQLQYSIVLLNSGGNAPNVALTDTLPSSLVYVPGSLSVPSGGEFGENGGVITWTGSINSSAQVLINFSALLTDTAPVGSVVTNTAELSFNGSFIELPAATTVISYSDTTVYLPIIKQQPPIVNLVSISRPTSGNQWTITWSTNDPTGTSGYEVQESHDQAFTNPVVFSTGPSELSVDRQPTATFNNVYYYRVRALGVFGVSNWSQTGTQIGNYHDGFSDTSSGWAMRRQDWDHIENQTRYQNGEWVHEMDSSWDFLISSPLVSIPTAPYRLEMRARHVEPSNLNSYGMIFGGDWDGTSPCPSANYSTCFTGYYRMNIIWFGDDPADPLLRVIVKRIDYHDPVNGHGRGVTIMDEVNARVAFPPSGHQRWAVEVYPNGLIKVFVNDNFVGQAVDSTYVNRPYFGAFSSTDEYAGLEAHFDWFEVKALP